MKIIQVPSSQGGLKNIGSEKAPFLVVKELRNNNLNEFSNQISFETDTVDIIKNNIEETNQNIFEKAKSAQGIFLGGDHSITYSLCKALKEKNQDPGLIILDAHPDCINNFEPPTHEDFVKVLVEKNIIKPENIILVGIRNWHEKEYSFLKKNKIRYFTSKTLSNDIQDCCDTIMESARKFKALHLSIDIDIVDPAFAPGTGHPEPAGISSRDLIYFIQRLKLLKNIRSYDLVEIDPTKDINNLTVKLGAKIITELK